MSKTVLNSSVIITLSALGYLGKLKGLFNEIIIANAIYEEICSAGQGLIGALDLKKQ